MTDSALQTEPDGGTRVKFLCLKARNKLQLLDGVSAVLSTGALGIAVWTILGRETGQYMLQMSEANTILAANHTELYRADATANTTRALAGACKGTADPRSWLSMLLQTIFLGFLLPLSTRSSFEVREVTAVYSDIEYRGATYAMASGQYDPLLALCWVFTCSVVFQAGRCWLYVNQGDKATNNKTPYFSQYRPYAGPDFWRWVEYALTAPLQIVIIASSFLVDDKSMLLLLGGLQGALMLLGYTIELQINKVCKSRCKPKEARRNRNHALKLCYLLVSAWALHAVVWYVLIERFNRQKNNLLACAFEQKMPGIVDFIVISQFMLFSLFGIAQTVQVAQVLSLKNRNSYKLVSAGQESRPPADHARWAAVAFAYGVLSVVSKTLLEYGFLVLIRIAPTTQ